MEIHVLKDGQELGPVSVVEFHAELDAGRISSSDLAWHEGLEGWVPIDQLVLESSTAPPPLARDTELVEVQVTSEERGSLVPSPDNDRRLVKASAFSWWPVTRAGTTTMVVCLILGFFASVAGGLPAIILFSAFVYLSLTALRFGLFKLFGHRRRPNSDVKVPVPLWRHPVAIGSACTLVLILCVGILSSEQSSNEARLYQAAWQENRQQYADHNSTSENIFRSTESFVRGLSGDPVAGFEIGKQAKAQNDQFNHDAALLQHAYVSSTQTRDSSDAIAGLAILGLFLLAVVMFVRFWWRRRRRKTAATGEKSQPQTA